MKLLAIYLQYIDEFGIKYKKVVLKSIYSSTGEINTTVTLNPAAPCSSFALFRQHALDVLFEHLRHSLPLKA